MFDENIDILCFAETKLDEAFPLNQFFMNVYTKLYQLDMTHRSGGILVYIKSHLPSQEFNRFEIPNDI